MKTQRMSSIPVLCVSVNITTDTMLKFDANVYIDAQYKLTFRVGNVIMKIRPKVQISMQISCDSVYENNVLNFSFVTSSSTVVIQNLRRMHYCWMHTIRCGGHLGGRGCLPGGACVSKHVMGQTPPTPPPMARILDTCLWKHYLSATTVEDDKNLHDKNTCSRVAVIEKNYIEFRSQRGKRYKGNCSLSPNFFTRLPVILVERNLFVVTGCRLDAVNQIFECVLVRKNPCKTGLLPVVGETSATPASLTGFPLDLENLEKWEYTWKTWKYHGILKTLINIMEKWHETWKNLVATKNWPWLPWNNTKFTKLLK